MPTKFEVLQSITFGARIAEEETEQLKHYFVKTDQWRRIFNGELDIIYGPKGSGKSAIYSFLVNSETELFEKNILLVGAENPRGVTVFKTLIAEPPTSEREFIRLWKIYFLIIIGNQLKESNFSDIHSRKIISKLEECNLLESKKSLQSYLRKAIDYVKSLTTIKSIAPGVDIGPTGVPTGFDFKIVFNEPSRKEIEDGFVSIEDFFDEVNQALLCNQFKLWIALDRLDVAFSESAELEKNGLRALFSVYLDLIKYDSVRLKIFLRDDIWQRITEQDVFREASHITRHTTIQWNKESLLNLIINRLLNIPEVVDFYKVNCSSVLKSFDEQTKLFYQIFPYEIAKLEKSKTLDWILSRTRDGRGIDSPREIIHLLNTSKDNQIRAHEIGNPASGKHMFDPGTILSSLKEVSKVKTENFLFSEFPNLKEMVMLLRNETPIQTGHSLGMLWTRKRKNAIKIGNMLVDIGFFEKKGTSKEPIYEVPHIYRPYLNMN